MYKLLGYKKKEIDDIVNNLDSYYLTYPIKKSSGKIRWIEAPLEPLKQIQRSINEKLLLAGPCHEIAHGFVCGRNAITAAQSHIGNKSFMCIDIKDFFPSIKRTHVMHALYVLKPLFEKLCTNTYGEEEFFSLSSLLLSNFGTGRLPQGAPTSPILSNIIMSVYEIDELMLALAKSNKLTITRYADDYVFSHKDKDFYFDELFLSSIENILALCNLNINYKKLKYLRPPKPLLVNGISVSSNKISIHSKYYKDLSLQIFLATKTGVSEEVYKQLKGKLEWVHQLNRKKYNKLYTMLQTIKIV